MKLHELVKILQSYDQDLELVEVDPICQIMETETRYKQIKFVTVEIGKVGVQFEEGIPPECCDEMICPVDLFPEVIRISLM